jgi:hypothetical protein
VRIVLDMMDNIWENEEEIVVDHCVDITLPIALLVIGVAGERFTPIVNTRSAEVRLRKKNILER